MAIDPMLYQKYSGRSGDPYERLGKVLAQNAKAKQDRDAMPKGFSGGMRVSRLPGIWGNLFFWLKDRHRERENNRPL
ncbi:MAG: hypothetical protein IT437_01970 [Phycisphaerales bacterium]|nr:hypothetical protein [Phycisphaerales bacterium]